MKPREIIEQVFEDEFGDDWNIEIRDFEHGFSDWYDCAIKAIQKALDVSDVPFSPKYKLNFCEKCHQMTNHLAGICQKCKVLNTVTPIAPADRWDAERFLNEKKDIWNHPRIIDINNKESYDVADLMAEFANKYYEK